VATATTLRAFNDLGRSSTPIFLLINHFLHRFSTFCEIMIIIIINQYIRILKLLPLALFLALGLAVDGFKWVKLYEMDDDI